MNDKRETISFRRLFEESKLLFTYLLRKWLFIVFVGIAGAVAGILYASWKRPVYTGELSFVLSDGNSQNGFISIASQFGIDVGGAANDVFSQDNVLYLMTSRKMMSRALFKKPPGSGESLINLYTRSEKINDSWKKYPRLAKAYPFPDNYNAITPVQDSLFRELYGSISKGILQVRQPDKKVSLFTVTTRFHDERFACYLTKFLVEETSAFYIETKTSISRKNLNMLRHEADSLQARINGSITSSAAATDRVFNLNQAYQVQRVPIQKSQIDASVTQSAYAEVLKNLEIAKISLEKAYPIYQLLDEPSLPLKQEKPGRLLCAVLFGGIAALLLTLYFAGKFLLTMQLAKEEKTKTVYNTEG